MFVGGSSSEGDEPKTPMDADGACRARTGDPQLAKAVREATSGDEETPSRIERWTGVTLRHLMRQKQLTNRLTSLPRDPRLLAQGQSERWV
jgi:hypothetical protein